MKRRVLSFIIALTLCLNLCPVQAFAADEGMDGGLCPHHPAHTDECGYVPDSPDALCTFVCHICPVEDLIGKLPGSVSEDNRGQVQAQLSEIYALYDGLTADEQQQVDLSPCISLWEQLDGISPAVLSDGLNDSASSDGFHILDRDSEQQDPFEVPSFLEFNTAGYTFTGTGSTAIRVGGAGKLYLTGTVRAPNGIGVEVLSGGFLSITAPETSVTSMASYALSIASGAKVHLSTGRYVGKAAAIRAEDSDFAHLLESGCAFFDGNGKLLLPAEAAKAKIIVVGQCSGHSDKSWTHTSGTTEHTWTCPYCGTVETENCTFTFDQDGKGTCASCGNTLTIVVDGNGLANLVYDGTLQPGSAPPVTVTLGDGTVLTEKTNYEVNYQPRTDAGEITVTVAGITFNGTFTKTYHVEQAQPGISWDAATCAVDYDSRGIPVDSTNLPNITITINANGEDLHPYLQYFYRKTGDTEFTPGLPTNAGEYEIKAYIPESQNYKAAETNPYLTLTINKIPAVTTAPTAKTLTYNREAQELVTAGVLKPGAAAEGAVIEFARAQAGPYSTDIPTGIGVSNYDVYYRVAETENYSGVSETLVQNPNATSTYKSARINHKEITPTVELEYSTTLYTGGDKEPKVTVKDGEYIIPNSEYAVAYKDHRNVGTATVTVSNASNGNYKILTATATFKITSQPQAALSITSQPNTVIYGDRFTLGTQGGSGNGDVTWKITAGSDVAEVDEGSGQVTVIGHGSVTVQAIKSGKDPATGKTNYDDATASWTFNAGLKPVTATVTAEDKFYGETYGGSDLKAAKVHAVVEQGVLPGDEITITGLTGTFSDENAGANKTVTVDTTNADISGKNSEHYAVTYSGLPVKAAIHKAVVHITAAPDAASLIYSGEAQALIDVSVLVVDTAGVQVEYALSENGSYSTAIPEGTNAGTYTVWYRVQETGNYTGLAPASVDVEISKKPVTPTITLSGDGLTVEEDGTCSYIYDGNAKTPVVTVKDGEEVIPESNYAVMYRNNVNVGTATVAVTAKADGNYEFNPVTTTFEIKKEQAKVITAPEAAGDPLTFNNRAQKLVTAGTGSGGTMVYSLDGEHFTDQIPAEINAKDYTVYYKAAGDGNHSDSDVGSVTVTIAPKTVNGPTIELLGDDGNPLTSYTYNGTAKQPTVIVKDGSTVITPDEYNVVYSDNTDAGRATVSITDKPGGNYTVTGSAPFVIVKADIEFAPAPKAAAITYDGKSHELLVPGTTSGGEVLYALNSPTSTYTAAIPTGTEAGNYTVYYKVAGDKNHNDLAVQSVPVTIQRKELDAITIELSPEGFEYDGTVKLPAVTVKDEKTVLPEEEYGWSCSVAAPTNVGTYTITISDKAGGNYDLSKLAPPANEAAFTIGQIPQEGLVIGGKPAATNYGDSFPLTVSGGSGDGAVTWEATGSASVDTTDGNVTITITNVGEATVTVVKAADTNYLSAETQWTFTAAPMPVTAAVTVDNKPYDGNTNAAVTSAGINTTNDDEVTIDPDSITATFDSPAVGTGKTVTLDTSKVQVTGDAAKYAISYPDTVTANITQAAAEITTAPAGIPQLTYNGQPQALVTAGQTNVGFIVYSLNENGPYSPEIPTGTNAGDYTVYYKVDGTADYTGVTVNTPPITVTIAPKNITPVIELSESSYLYDGTKKDPKITVKDGKTVIDEAQYTVTWAGTKNQTDAEMLTVADTYTAAIASAEGGNYTFFQTVTVEIVAASQAALKITGKPDHVCYGDTVTTLDTTGGSGNGTVTWRITEGGTNSTITPAGELTVKDTGSITVTAERAVPNYGTVSDTWTFTVEPKPVTAEVTVAQKVYDGNNTATVAKAGVKAGDLVNEGDTITITGLKGTFDDVNAGTNKTVTLDRSDPGFTITSDTDKYAVSIPATAQADIKPRAVNVTVTLSDHDLKTDDSGYYYTFDGTEKKPAVAVRGSDETGFSAALTSADYTVDYAKNKNFGTADVTVTAKEGGNYTFADKTVNFEIRKGAAVLTETPKAKDLTYDGTLQDLVTVGTATGGTVVYSSTGADNSYEETIPQGTNAGTYTVYYMVKGDANHDSTAPGQVSVTIKSKTITPIIALSGDGLVTGADGACSYVYDGSAKKPAVTVTGGVDANAIAATEYSVSYQDNTNAGTAKVIVSDANGGNYIVNGTATFEITKKAPVFTAPEGKENLQYNGAPQELVKAGVTNDGTVVYSVNGGSYSAAIPTAAAVGDYEVTYKVLGDANHSDTTPVALGTVTIAKNTVNKPTITLSSDTFRYNGSQQKPTITVCDDNGLLIPEHEYTATIAPTTGGDAGIVSVGTYTVTVTTPDDSNYVITTGNTRTFDIVPANQETISITGTQAQVRYGDSIQLGITGGTSSGTVTWTVTGSSTISATGLLTVKDVGGPITVTAKRSAGGNYTDVSATWEFSAAKKQVTAVVTADDRTYAADDKSATVHVSVPSSELVPGDSITIEGVTGTFDDPNVGTNKKVTVNSTNPAPTVEGTNAGNYEITYPATTTASILAEAATVDTDPTPNDLTYDAGQAQALVEAGIVTGGIMVYSLDGTNFTTSVPKAKDAGTYTVYFKAQGDGNHTDSEVKSTPVTIGKQPVTPQSELTPSSAQYDGKEHKPTVTLWDGSNNVIPASEYKVTYVSDNGANWTDKGEYTVKIEDMDRGNYVVATTTKAFTISTTAQNPLEITNKPGLVYYGDTFTLSAVGGSGNEKVTWSVDDAGKAVVEIDANGFVKIIGTGSATITATKPGGGNYDDTTAAYPLNALKKPITAIVTADDKVYDGVTPATATIHVTWKDGDLVGDDTISTEALVGTFDNPNVGQNKTVTITGGPISSDKYEITIPATTTASILKADIAAPAVAANDRDYDGTAQPLVTGGDDNTRYCDSRDGVYSANVPTGTNAGTYTVWYKELGDANHNDSAPKDVTVTISRKTLTLSAENTTLSGNDLQTDSSTTPPSYSYTYDGTEKKPTVTIMDGAAVIPASEYTVDYSDNKNVGTATVTITSNAGGNYTFDEQTVNFTITSAAAQLTGSPQAKDLTYTGQAQELVTVGTADGGHIEYLQEDGTYGRSIPKGTNAGTYTVTYKVAGDGNYAGTDDTWTVSVTIKQKEIVSPKVTVSGTYTYNGDPQEPAADKIKVEDGTTEIPASNYTVTFQDNVNAGTATVIITNANGGNYIVNGTGIFTIGKAAAAVETAPTGNKDLPYNGTAQALAEAGKASGGTMVYALSETGEYSPAIPAQTAVGNYTVWYKVQGDGNHSDSEPASVDASIIANTVTSPTVQVTPEAVTYNGKKQEPMVTVKDDSGLLIDGSEYTVTYADADGNDITDLTDVGTYTLTIASKADGNYTFNATGTFEILPADQTPLTITGQRERVYYGDKIQLGTSGGSGTVTWKVDDGAPASIDNGLLTITGVGSVTVTATSKATGYADQTATWSFYAEKKPVTAVVTAEAKTYDGKKDAAVTATLQSSDLVNGDTVKIKLSGSFEDPNAGTNKKVTVDSTSPDFTDSTGNYENYSITYPATTTASIFKADVDETKVTAPTAKTDLEYTGIAQALVTAGSSTEGTLEYSTDGMTYSASLPTGTDADSYDVWYRVKGDGNHNDTAGTKLEQSVTIAQQTVTSPTIEFTPTGASYDGAVHKPTVTVKDKKGHVIPDSEYTVAYGGGNWKDVGKYTVTITDEDGGNYTITQTDAEFEILIVGQSPLTITNQPGAVQYGDTFTLSTTGGSGTGAVSWQSSHPEVASIDQNGLVKVGGSGSTTIIATKQSDSNYGAATATWTFSAEKKPVKAVVTAKNKVYDTDDRAQLEISWKDGDLLGNDADAITLNLTGKFDNADVGDNKTVTITGTVPDSTKYEITYNTTTTASITPKAATVTGVTAIQPLTYTGQPQELVNAGSVDSGNVKYSLDGGASYSLDVPKATNAGTYTVWYKAVSSGNFADSTAASVSVTIAPKSVSSPVIELSSETFDYDGTAKKPDVVVKDGNIVIPASEYTVSYSSNVNAGTNATVTISDAPDGNYIVSGTATFTIKSASAVLTLAPQERELTYNGKAQALVTAGTAVNGHVEYSTDGVTYSTAIPKETDADTYDVYYKVVGDPGYGDTTPQVLSVTIAPKQVTPTIMVGGVPSYSTNYTGSAVTPNVTVVVDGKQLTYLTDYSLIYSNNGKPGTATVTVQSISSGNYQFYAVATFEITKAKATFSLEPDAKTGLVYTGEAQELVELGMGQNGATVVYSLNGGAFYPFVPTATEVGSYVVSAKVQGNEMYADSDVKSYRVTIGKNVLTEGKLNVTLSADSVKFTGYEQKPTVTVRDVENNVIVSASEYSVTYSNNINVGTASVTVTSTGKNYSFQTTVHFTITDADQPSLTITNKPDTVCYGDTLRLSTTGGSGTVTWSVESGNESAEALGGGRFKVKGSGSITIKAAAGDSSDTWTFYADPKPVTAVVTAADKPYDGSTAVTLAVVISGLVSGDSIGSDSITASGCFTDANAGTNKTVIITGLTVPEDISAKYDISYPATTTANITPAPASVTNAPQKVTQALTYTGSAQPLVTPGAAANGNMAYSLDGVNYSFTVPTGTDAKTYTVWYKAVAADENHKDSTPVKMADTVTIAPNTDTPTVLCIPDTFQYDGTPKTPTVVVRDSAQRIIPEGEYTVTGNTSAIKVGSYTVTVTDKTGGNYEFSDPVTGTFEIVSASQNPLSIITDKSTVCYGDTFRLSAMGGSGSGAIHWSIAEGNGVAAIDSNGVVTVKGTGGFTVQAYREAADGYSASNTASVPFDAKPKPVTPTVTADDKPYDGTTNATLHAVWKTGDLVGEDTIALTVEGEFVTADAGDGKRVKITSGTPSGQFGNYLITWPDSAAASIYKVDAKLQTAPGAADLTYTGNAQPLLTGGSTVNGIGTIVYSTSQNGAYSTDIPTGTDAGTYTVWYKVADSVNYTGIPAAAVEVEIARAKPSVNTAPTASGTAGQKLSDIPFSSGGATDVPGTFAWADGSIKAENGVEYDVIFTPNDLANYVPVTIKVVATSQTASSSPSSPSSIPASRPDTPSTATNTLVTPPQTATTVQNGTASTVVSAADGSKLVQGAVESQSRNVVIKPEITGNVTKSAVSIPSSTVSQLGSKTDAALTVSSPVADVTIPNAALDTLSRAGGTVSVVTEQVEQSVALTLTAGGETVKEVPGGLTLTVPVEDAGPGTVAVLVHDDGTRETVRKSVVEDGVMSIPLSGSATVEIVDNSKDFADVPPESWAADAVDFASSHELFSGTSETTFSPDQAMSRGMLATVLYRLEGSPDLDLTDLFLDVSSDAWYAEGVAWAAENNIVGGYGDGQFGPDDDITREQFVVMLWRYAGSPKAGSQALDFVDADQVSTFALEALCWAVENGILHGVGNGVLDPGGTATRAQAAQLLKNFMENT